ncbi:transaldolase [Trypanosoma conorhini]|uniref:Transaldolase n=1 Tax=Trypanosoma conorhini TaxID=83891 RepID=A0A422NI53_9TRYP|nr:transaldolase [Trypanosoma conorhini]RNF05137.1 transaldolase [Trypanosoma conorhini]
MSKLAELKKYTVVVADTADFSLLAKFRPEDATTNPSLVLAGSQLPQYAKLIDDAVAFARENVERLREGLAPGADEKAQLLELAVDKLTVSFGVEILKVVPGRVSTEVDARLSYDTARMVAKARHLVRLYEECGCARSRLYIKLATTWEGIQAARQLEADGINCNLTLLFSFGQAVACAQAGVSLISPFVGRILDWYKAHHPAQADSYVGAQDPGVVSVTRIYNYYKQHGYKTVVMGASFRSAGEVLELAGCDKLTISPKLLEELDAATGAVPRKLDPAHLTETTEKLPEFTGPESLFAGEPNTMAKDKLEEGIRGFAKDTEKLEAHIATLL